MKRTCVYLIPQVLLLITSWFARSSSEAMLAVLLTGAALGVLPITLSNGWARICGIVFYNLFLIMTVIAFSQAKEWAWESATERYAKDIRVLRQSLADATKECKLPSYRTHRQLKLVQFRHDGSCGPNLICRFHEVHSDNPTNYTLRIGGNRNTALAIANKNLLASCQLLEHASGLEWISVKQQPVFWAPRELDYYGLGIDLSNWIFVGYETEDQHERHQAL